MKDLFGQAGREEILQRIDRLTHASAKLWGKMEVDQMLAHCSIGLEVAMGQRHVPRLLIGRILGPIIKSKFYDESDFRKNSPTDKSFIIPDRKNFEEEKAKLKKLVVQFAEGGTEKVTAAPHAFFGKLTPQQWSIGMYKHLDHHLRQFGV